MTNFLSKLFGKGNNASQAVPPYPSAMLHPDSRKDAAFSKQIFAYLEFFHNTSNLKSEVDAEMEAFYRDTVTKECKEMIFSNSLSNMARILNALSEKIPNKGGSRTAHLQEIQMFYISVFSRALIMDPFQIRESMVHRFSELPKDLVVDCTAESLAYICLGNEKIADQILGRLSLKAMTEENAIKNAGVEEKYLNDPKYGLVPDKPVFINGFGPHHIYLDALCTPDGIELKNERCGSMPVRGIEGPVDIYDLYLPNGKKYKTIYLCLYGQRNSITAPQGLSFKENKAV